MFLAVPRKMLKSMIRSIKFRKPLLGRRFVVVETSVGNTYKIKREGAYAVVIPPCNEGEKEALKAVYNAVWEWLNGKGGQTLDRGAKIACGKLVSLLEWPAYYTTDTQTRLEYVVGQITKAENIF